MFRSTKISPWAASMQVVLGFVQSGLYQEWDCLMRLAWLVKSAQWERRN
jgi:hypothetical protein